MSETQDSDGGPSTVLEHGAEVYFKHEEGARVYDRIEFMPSGMVVCFNKQAYSKDIFPREQIVSMHTHTSDEEENAEWW